MLKRTIVLIIISAAAVFRFWQPASMPLALYPNAGPALAGIFTVLGLYFLAKQLFNWQIAALASYLMAISSWHVYFSRLGAPGVAAALFLVWGVYFFWRGLAAGRYWNFAAGGIFWGLGFYTSGAFIAMPLALLLTLLAYRQAVKKDFDREKYLHARNRIARGLALFLIIVILVALPAGYQFFKNHAIFLGGNGQSSIFAALSPFMILAKNIIKIPGLFGFGDHALLLWPINALFVLGLIRSWIKFFGVKKSHGHFSTAQTMLLSWFLLVLASAAFSNDGFFGVSDLLLAAPVMFIWAGESLWWIADKLGDWYYARDLHEYRFRRGWLRESSLAAVLAVIILLASFTAAEYDEYFNKQVPASRIIFNQNAK